MENASKALIMAGSILIGVIIMTIGVTIFTSFGSTSEKIQKQMNEKAIAEFNAHFTKYVGMQDCTIHDIVSLANFARKFNKEIEIDSYITVILDNKNLATETGRNVENLIKLLEEEPIENKDIKYYKCTDIEYDEYGRINFIQFESR